MDLAGFVAEFPEFADTNPVVVQAKLDEAARWMDRSSQGWGPFGTTSMASTNADDGQKYLAAHIIAQMPFGASTRMEPTKGQTTYGDRYIELRDSLGTPTFLVAGVLF